MVLLWVLPWVSVLISPKKPFAPQLAFWLWYVSQHQRMKVGCLIWGDSVREEGFYTLPWKVLWESTRPHSRNWGSKCPSQLRVLGSCEISCLLASPCKWANQDAVFLCSLSLESACHMRRELLCEKCVSQILNPSLGHAEWSLVIAAALYCSLCSHGCKPISGLFSPCKVKALWITEQLPVFSLP